MVNIVFSIPLNPQNPNPNIVKDGSLNSDRQAPIDISPERFRSAGHALIDRIADVLTSIRERKVTAGLSLSEIRALIDASAGVPDEGFEFNLLLSQITELLTRY